MENFNKESQDKNTERIQTEFRKPSSSGNDSFRKHNKLGYLRFMRRKKKKISKNKGG